MCVCASRALAFASNGGCRVLERCVRQKCGNRKHAEWQTDVAREAVAAIEEFFILAFYFDIITVKYIKIALNDEQNKFNK